MDATSPSNALPMPHDAALGCCPSCQRSWQGQLFCPNDGTLREAGALIGERYQLERLLGAGGMGFVFAARHKLLGRPVAIKILRAELAVDAEQVRRFLREAQLCSQLRHQNIVEITDFGRDESGHLYLAMDLLMGSSLAEVIAAEGKLPTNRALKILRQLCRALSCAHEAGVVHRDLTPRNVFLVTESGRDDVAKLLDFGIARSAGGLDRITSTGVALGTTPYMPPEQLRGVVEQDRLVDIYALGVLAHELLTGGSPFVAQSQAALIAEKLSQASVDLRGTDLDARAPAVAKLIGECLAADPRQRPSSAAEVEQRLLSSGGVASEQTEDLVGARVGSYRLLRLLGAGGVGSVWHGEHPVIGSQVAIKILHPEMCELEEAVRRFVVEAQAVNRIDSPHIVKTFDFGKLADGRDYAVMELLRGETLGSWMARGPLSWEQARPVALALANALASAHAVGIVHRDLKPENIHVGRPTAADGLAVKVLDFGIAKLLGGDVAETHRTQLGICLGTPLYAAPEQMTGEPLGAPVDVYGLGAVFFEMLTGEPPFSGSIQELALAKVTQVAPQLGAKVAGLPPSLAALVDAMLAFRPERRPTMAEVLEVVRRLGEATVDSASSSAPCRTVLGVGAQVALQALGQAAPSPAPPHRSGALAEEVRVAAVHAEVPAGGHRGQGAARATAAGAAPGAQSAAELGVSLWLPRDRLPLLLAGIAGVLLLGGVVFFFAHKGAFFGFGAPGTPTPAAGAPPSPFAGDDKPRPQTTPLPKEQRAQRGSRAPGAGGARSLVTPGMKVPSPATGVAAAVPGVAPRTVVPLRQPPQRVRRMVPRKRAFEAKTPKQHPARETRAGKHATLVNPFEE